jgi:hypothetical protein
MQHTESLLIVDLLMQPINMFINSADELYGPITTIRHDGQVKHVPWTKFVLATRDWERVNDTQSIIAVST